MSSADMYARVQLAHLQQHPPHPQRTQMSYASDPSHLRDRAISERMPEGWRTQQQHPPLSLGHHPLHYQSQQPHHLAQRVAPSAADDYDELEAQYLEPTDTA